MPQKGIMTEILVKVIKLSVRIFPLQVERPLRHLRLPAKRHASFARPAPKASQGQTNQNQATQDIKQPPKAKASKTKKPKAMPLKKGRGKGNPKPKPKHKQNKKKNE